MAKNATFSAYQLLAKAILTSNHRRIRVAKGARCDVLVHSTALGCNHRVQILIEVGLKNFERCVLLQTKGQLSRFDEHANVRSLTELSYRLAWVFARTVTPSTSIWVGQVSTSQLAG